VHAASSAAFPDLCAEGWPKDSWPILGVAVNAAGSNGFMKVCWALAQRRESQSSNTRQNKRSAYNIYDIFGNFREPAGGVIQTANSSALHGQSGQKPCKWHDAFTNKQGPSISKEHGNKFFPYIKVTSSGKPFKVNHLSIPFASSAQNLLTVNPPLSVSSCLTTSE
jgi:hypothetical protein